MMQMTYGDLHFKFRRIRTPPQQNKNKVFLTLHLTNKWVWSKYFIRRKTLGELICNEQQNIDE